MNEIPNCTNIIFHKRHKRQSLFVLACIPFILKYYWIFQCQEIFPFSFPTAWYLLLGKTALNATKKLVYASLPAAKLPPMHKSSLVNKFLSRVLHNFSGTAALKPLLTIINMTIFDSFWRFTLWTGQHRSTTVTFTPLFINLEHYHLFILKPVEGVEL